MKIALTSLLVLALLFSLTEISFSQKKDEGDDVYNTSKPNPVSTINNISLVDDMAFSIDDFVRGYMIMPSKTIKNGLLRFNGTTVIFKDTLTKKTKRFNAQEIKGFIVRVDTNAIHNISKAIVPGMLYKNTIAKVNYSNKIPVDTFKVYADSFVVKPIGGHAAPVEKIVHNNKFVKQLIYGQKVCLCKTTEMINNPGMMNGGVMTGGSSYLKNIFYFKKKNESTYTEIPTGKRAFKKMMAAYVKDNDLLTQAINNDQYSFNELAQITII